MRQQASINLDGDLGSSNHLIATDVEVDHPVAWHVEEHVLNAPMPRADTLDRGGVVHSMSMLRHGCINTEHDVHRR